jgi:ribosomal protein S27E
MRSILPAAALAIVLLLAIPPAMADNDSMKVVVLVERNDYSVGSNVELSVWVHEGGVPADPDSTPEVSVLSAAPRSVPVFKFGNGLFKGNFTIQPGDVVGGLVPVEASATIGKSSDSDKTYNRDTDIASIQLSAAPAGAFEVRLFTTGVSDSVIRPGATVSVAAEVAASGSPVQPDGFSLTASYLDPEGGSRSEPLNATSPRTGRFEAAYALPQVSYDLQLVLTARASSGNLSASGSLTLPFNQFWVVYHNVSKSPTGTVFYLYAGDPSGRALAGATFDFSYWPDGNVSLSRKGTAAPADTFGKSRLSLEFEEGTRTLTVQGRVNASGKSQRFSGVIDVSTGAAAPRPSTSGFEMLYTGPGDLYTPGKMAVRQYIAFNNSQPLRNSELYTYIVVYPYTPGSPAAFTPVALLQARPYTTDLQGRLSLPFTPPAYDAYLIFYFKNATGTHPKPSGYFFNHDSNDGQYFSETADMVFSGRTYSGSDVKVQASPYKPGSPASVKATSGGAGNGTAWAMWLPGDFDPALPGGSPSAEWQVWEGVASYLNRTSGGYSGSVTIPAFMPDKVKYTVVVFVSGSGPSLPQYGSATLARAARDDPGTGQDPQLYLILIIIGAGVVGGVAGGLGYRRRRALAARQPAGESKTITCPSCRTPFPVVQGPQPVKIRCPSCGTSGTLPALAGPPAGAAAAAPAAAPAAPAAGAGQKLSIPCPQCGTVFDIIRGAGPTRVQCPRCGKSGTIAGTGAEPAQAPAAQAGQPAPAAPAPAAGPGAMQVQMAAAAPAGPMMAQAATDMPRPEPVVQTKTIACPQCRNRFTIEKKDGPQQIKCPHCGKEGTIGRAPAPAAAAPAPQAVPQMMAPQPAQTPQPQPPGPRMTAQQPPAFQPRYQGQMAGPQPARTPMGQEMRPQQHAASPAGQPAAPAAAGKLITCPACRNRFAVGDPRRPIKVRCPNCGKEGTLAR